MTTLASPTLAEFAARIDAHLKRFEADPAINTIVREGSGIHMYWKAGAYVYRNRVMVRYVGFQATTTMQRSEAESYLQWLDAGGIGKHTGMARKEAGGE